MDIRVDEKWPIRLEIALGVQPGLPVADWTWTDITDLCFTGSQPAPIQITYGRQDEMSETQPAAMTTTLDNQDGRFTPGNVTSPLWPYWKRGLPVRARLDGLNLAGLLVRDVPSPAQAWADTPDHLSFAVTDLDVRIDITPDSWRPAHGEREVLAGQYGTSGAERAWYLGITNGVPALTWSGNGTGVTGTIAATAAVPASAGRLTLRVTLDVDNGDGGHTVTFYTGPSVIGPWTPLGAPVTGVGATAIFNSFAPLAVGAADDGNVDRALDGMVHQFRLCSSIDGAAVADPHFAAINPGAAEFTDAAGRSWSVHPHGRITDPAIRYSGQLVEIAPTWPYGELEGDGESQVSITAAGLLRRIGQGASPLHSSMRRGLATNPKPPVAYWSCEDGKAAKGISSTLGGSAMTITGGLPRFAENTDFACSAPLPALNNSVWTGTVPPYANPNLQSQTRFLLSIPDDGEADANNGVICRVHTTGTAARWDVMYGSGFGGILGLKIYDPAGTLIHDGTLFDFDMNGQPARIGVSIEQNGPNVDWALAVIKVPDDINTGSGAADTGTLTNRTGGVVSSVSINPGALFKESAVGHVSVNREIASGFDMLAELGAWVGETAGDRFRRLCAQETIPRWVSPQWTDTEPMGRQGIDTLLTLIGEGVAADRGVLAETLDTLGLHYRARIDIYDQAPVVVLDASAGWGQIVLPLSPIDDDQAMRNDVEVDRVDGSTFRVTDVDHIAEHGRYDEQVTVNVHRDLQLPDVAGWRLHLGTWPGMRYPEISPALDAHPELAATWLRMRPGDLVRVTGLPRQHPDGPVDLNVQGWTESIWPHFWTATANTTPAGPWDTAHAAAITDPDQDRADTAGCQTATAAAPGGHSIYAATTKGPLWTDSPAELPLPLRIDGEDVHVELVEPGVSDVFTGRTVANGWGTSTNGIPWTIAGGAAADYSVDSGFGLMSLTDRGNNRFCLAALAVDSTRFSMRIAGHISVNPTGGAIIVGMAARMADFDNFLMCRIVFLPGNLVALDMVRRVNSVETLVGFTPQIAISTGDDIGARFEGDGNTLRARIWNVSDNQEPGDWMITGTDPAPKQGQVAVWSRTETNNTNTLPVTVSWSQVALDNPQRLTLPTGPGFQRAHPIGRDVRLTRTAIVAW